MTTVIPVDESDITVPEIVVLWFVRRIVAPEMNFVPTIVTGIVLMLYPETGVTEVIVGFGS